ncbi:homoserine dehydrogenase, partial [Bacillus pseudomycoides]
MITDHQERLIHQVGCPVKVTKVLVQNIEKEREVEVPSTLLTQDANEILDNPNIDVVIEVMGGIDDAKAYILQALQSGKHVVTANKDLMALHGAELLAVAKDNK